MLPQRDWNCTECLRLRGTWGRRQCAVQVSGAAEQVYHRVHCPASGLTMLVNSGVCAQLQGSSFVETRPGWGWGFCSGAVASGLFSGFPEITKTISVPLCSPRTIWNLFFPTQNYWEYQEGKTQRAKNSRLFLLLYYDWYTILSQFMVYNCWLIHFCHHSFIWQLNNVPYLPLLHVEKI